MLVLNEVTNFVSDPHTKDFLSNFDVPKYVWTGLAIMAFVTWIAHGRSDA